MDITGCKLCGRIVNAEGTRICRNCMHRLEKEYSEIHNHMRDNQDEAFDIERLSEELDINPADIQTLIELGYNDREIAENSDRERARRELAGILTGELEDIKKRKITTYGGSKYARSSDSRQYVYDVQTRNTHRK